MAMKILPYSKTPENPYREKPFMVHDLMGVRALNDFKSQSKSEWIHNIPYVDHRYPDVSSLKQQLPHFSEKHAFSPDGAYLVFESTDTNLQAILMVYCTQSWEIKQTIVLRPNQELDSVVSFFFAPDSTHLFVIRKQVLAVYSVHQVTALSETSLPQASRKPEIQDIQPIAASAHRLNSCNWSLGDLRICGFFDSKDFFSSPQVEFSRSSMTEFCIFADSRAVFLLDLRDWDPSQVLQGRVHDVTPTAWNLLMRETKEIFLRAPLNFCNLSTDNSSTKLIEYSVSQSQFQSVISGISSSQSTQLVLTKTQEIKLGGTDGILDSAFGSTSKDHLWWADPQLFTLSCLKADPFGNFETAADEPLILEYSAGTPVSLTSVLGGKFAIMHCKSPDMGRIFSLCKGHKPIEVFRFESPKFSIPPAINQLGELVVFRKADLWTYKVEVVAPPTFQYLVPGANQQQLDVSPLDANNIHFAKFEGVSYRYLIQKTRLFVGQGTSTLKDAKLSLEALGISGFDEPLTIVSSSFNFDQGLVFLQVENSSSCHLISYDLKSQQFTNQTAKLVPGFHFVEKLSAQYALVSNLEGSLFFTHLGNWNRSLVDSTKGVAQVAFSATDVLFYLNQARSKPRRISQLASISVRRAESLADDLVFLDQKWGSQFYAQLSPDSATLLVRTRSYVYLYDTSTLKKKVLLQAKDKFDLDPAMSEYSPDSKHVAVFASSSGKSFLMSVPSREIKIEISTSPAYEGSQPCQQHFSFDTQGEYLSCLKTQHQSSQQSLEVYSLLNYQHVCSISVPKSVKILKHQIVHRHIKVIGVFLASEEHNSRHELVELTYPFGLDPSCEWLATRFALRDMNSNNQTQADEAAERLFNLWSTIPPSVMNNRCPVPLIMIGLNNVKHFERFLESQLDVGSLVHHHGLLRVMFETKSTEWLKVVSQQLHTYLSQGELATHLKIELRDLVVSKQDQLLTNELVRSVVKPLLVSKRRETVAGQLIDERSTMIESKGDLSVDSKVQSLLHSNPDNITDFSLCETGFWFDLEHGSQFSCALFTLLSKMPDDDLKSLFRPIVHYKWNSIFYFALVYGILFWTNNILLYIYLGFHMNSVGLGVASLVTTTILTLYELKSMLSSFKLYRSSLWNFYDCFVFLIAYFAVIYNFSSSEESRQGNAFNVWTRLVSVVFLGARSVTWLRIFEPTRYMITMVMEVFYDMAPFLVILASNLSIYAYAWRLVAGLGLSDLAPEPSFYNSVLSSVNIIFGNSPDPLGDGSTAMFDIIKFIIYMIGNVVLALVLLNFLIAVISGTHDRINEDKSLHDVKELLSLIQDFDLFFKSRKPQTEVDPDEITGRKFLLLVKDTATAENLPTEVTQKLAAIEQRLASLEASQASLVSTVKAASQNYEKILKEQLHSLLHSVKGNSQSTGS